MIAFDTETHAIQPGSLTPRLVCLAVSDGQKQCLFNREEAIMWARNFLPISPALGGHNVSFDLAVLCNEDPSLLPLVYAALDEGRIYDSMILEKLHDIGRGKLGHDSYSLGGLESRYFGKSRDSEKHGPDSWRLRYGELDGVPIAEWPRAAKEYPLRDARGTWDLINLQLTRSGRLNIPCHREEMKAAFALHLSACRGMKTDPETVAEVVGEIERSFLSGRNDFLKSGIVKKRKARKDEEPDCVEETLFGAIPMKYAQDTKKLREKVTAAYQGRPPCTPKGKVSTTRSVLQESGSKELEAWAKQGANAKLLSTYAEVLRKGTEHAINPGINVLVSSGRTSYFSPNLQNLPRQSRVRECFVPSTGYLFCSVDFAALELCTLAQVCLNWFGHSEMAQRINRGEDLHLVGAAELLGMSYDEAVRRKKDGDPRIKSMRQVEKAFSFGRPGGMGPMKLLWTLRKDDVRICEALGESHDCAQNERIRVLNKHTGLVSPPTCKVCYGLARQRGNAFLKRYPEVKEYHAKIKWMLKREMPLVSEVSGMIREEPEFTAAANHYFQSLGALVAKRALVAADRAGYEIKGFLHDEILAQLPSETASERAVGLARLMVDAGQPLLPGVTLRAEPALMPRWYKGAEPVWENGKLIPWEPT